MTEDHNRPIRIIIVDDHPVVCSGLSSMLRTHASLDVEASAASGEEALSLLREMAFDVMLLDLRMPGMDGIATLEKLRQIPNAPKVIILTSFEKEEDIYRAIRAGAMGYLVKDVPETEMVAAIHAVASGRLYIPHSIAARLAGRMQRPDLTVREIDVLELLALGYTNKQIASSLKISDHTVRCHVNNIMEKMQVSDRTEAAVNALKTGVLHGAD